LTTHFTVLDLCGGFQQVGDFRTLRLLFVVNHDFVDVIAKLAVPVLITIFGISQLAELVKHTLAPFAEEWVSSGNLALVLECPERDLGHIRVKFLSELSHFLLRCANSPSLFWLAHL